MFLLSNAFSSHLKLLTALLPVVVCILMYVDLISLRFIVFPEPRGYVTVRARLGSRTQTHVLRLNTSSLRNSIRCDEGLETRLINIQPAIFLFAMVTERN